MSRRLTISLPILVSLVLATTSAAEIRWQFDAGGRVFGNPTIGEVVYVAAGKTLHALTPDGEQLWHRELEGEVAAGVTLEEDTLYVHSSAGLHALDTQGQPLWTYESEDLGPLVDGRSWGWGNQIVADPWGWYRSAPLVQGETVFFGTSAGVHAISTQTGELRWQVPVGPVTADLIRYEETILVASWSNSIYALEVETGKLRWQFKAQVPRGRGASWVGYAGCNLTPVLHGEHLLFGNRGTYFYSIDARTGTEVWSSKVGASWIGSPAVTTDDAVYYGLSDGNAVMGQLVSTGAQTLFFRTGSAVFARPALSGRQLIAGTLTGRLFGIDTASGQGEELLNLGPEQVDWAGFFDPEIVPDNTTRYEGDAWAIDRMLTEANGILSLTLDGNTAYVGTGSGRLYAIGLP